MRASFLLMVAIASFLACGRHDSGPDGGPGSDGGPKAVWWSTCGDPIGTADGGHRDAGLATCTSQTVGAVCTELGALCDPLKADNSYLNCSLTDPRQGPGGCPISRLRNKTGIHYLSEAELDAVRAELLALPLATYRYRQAADSRPHLGFMIDGHESLICVDAERDQIDLYAYTSMAVAALKVQAHQIEELRNEIRDLASQRPLQAKAKRGRREKTAAAAR